MASALPSGWTERLCPVCGRLTFEAVCPRDAVPTVVMRTFARRPDSYRPGEVVAGRYRLVELLGRGGFGCVYGAEHTGTGQAVAVKLLALDENDLDAIAIRRFVREARVTAGLCHPNTVRVFDAGQDEGGPLFIAMERLRGPTLGQVLSERLAAGTPLPEAEVIDIGLQVLGSLAEAHERGIVHRDLKPANLVLTAGPEGERIVKVLDFGVARTSGSTVTQPGSVQGTPAYMSPEQCLGREVDGRTDLYSLSVLLFAGATTRLPFDHPEPVQTMHLHVRQPPPDPRTLGPVSAGLAWCLLRGLAKAPEDRFAHAAEMRDALLRVQKGESPETMQSSLRPVLVLPDLASGSADTSRSMTEETLDGPTSLRSSPLPVPSSPLPVPSSPMVEPVLPVPPPRPWRRWLVGLAGIGVGVVLVGLVGLRGPEVGAGSQAPEPAAPLPPPIEPAPPQQPSDHALAAAAFRRALDETSLERKLDHARQAARLAPEVTEYARLVQVLAAAPAPLPAGPLSQPVATTPTAPTPPPPPVPRLRRPARASDPTVPALAPALVE